MIVIGFHAVEALLNSKFKVRSIHCLDRASTDRAVAVRNQAQKTKVNWHPYAQKDKARFEAEFKRMGGTPAELETSQGIFAEVAEIESVPHLEMLRNAKEKEPHPIIVYLDSITDPQNLGSILRSSAFFGVSGLVITENRSSPLTPAAIKISSGGFIHVPISRVPNLARAMDEAKEEGFWIVGLSEHAKEQFRTARLDSPIGLVIGNEESGVRQLTEKTCDFMVSLPGHGPLVSLNAAT
ncbi:MAG: 23S rRNA (guanosine(2251)-2'-O)-methyltransferase RlmB, partial [Bdellovibrionota bacterium]